MYKNLKDLLWLGVFLTAFLSAVFMVAPVDLVSVMSFVMACLVVMAGNDVYRRNVSRIEFFLVCVFELASFAGAFFFRVWQVAAVAVAVFLIRLASIRAEENDAIHDIA